MLRSFHYAIYMGELEYSMKMPDDSEFRQPWLKAWYRIISNAFLTSYMQTAQNASFMPEESKQIADLLSVFTIEKAIYEADYELNNRPDWLYIPLNGLEEIMDRLVNE